MKTTTSMTAAMFATVTLIVGGGQVFGQAAPKQQDFDQCNQMAAAEVKSPSASPGSATSGAASAAGPTTSSGASTTAPAGSAASPGTSGTASGAGAGTPTTGPLLGKSEQPTNPGSASAPAGSGSASASGTSRPDDSQKTGPLMGRPSPDPSGVGATTSRSDDSGLRGMAAAGQSDPEYQRAYRECLRRRGF
jgi:hypothetical protein